MVNVPITHIDEDEIIEKIYKTPRPTNEEEKEFEDTAKKFNTVTILIAIAFLSGIIIASVANYYANGDMRKLNTTISEWKDDQDKASKNNAIIWRAVNDNKSIETRQIKRVEEVQNIMSQMLTPKSVTIK